MDAMQDLATKLQAHRERDASGRYAGHPVAPSELMLYEEEIGVRLPADYRQFLLEIGWGVGPWNGLLRPRDALAAIRSANSFVLPEYWIEDATPPSSRPFPFTRAQAEESRQQDTWLTHDCDPPGVWLGCVPIAHQGCDSWTALVTTGDLAGSVWNMYNHDGWQPAQHDRRRWPLLPAVVGFLEWYHLWLEGVS